MVDIFDRIQKDSGGPIGQYFEKAFGYYMYPRLEGELGPHMVFNGKEVLNWSLNNYLGLANHPEVRKADAEAADTGNDDADGWDDDAESDVSEEKQGKKAPTKGGKAASGKKPGKPAPAKAEEEDDGDDWDI